MKSIEMEYKEILKKIFRVEPDDSLRDIFFISLVIFFFFTPVFGDLFYTIIIPIFHLSIFIMLKRISYKSTNKSMNVVLDWIDLVSEKFAALNYFDNEKEKIVFKRNLRSLHLFEFTQEYKYYMIALASIFEFLLIKYCKMESIKPEDYNPPNGQPILANSKKLVNYIQTAIINNLFDQKNTWSIVQHNLRNFRNYVHISREINDEEIDVAWFKTIKPCYFRLIRNMIDKEFYTN